MRLVICEAARVDELAAKLIDALHGRGVVSVITAMSIRPVDAETIAWVGMPASPDGGTFDLRAPIEGIDEPPRWVEYFWHGESAGWNYTRDLVAFKLA